jgi:hypothetical protein
MSTLAEIERATENLAPQEKERLLLFLAGKLRQQRAATPAPRELSSEQIAAWIAQDEAEMEQFRRGE